MTVRDRSGENTRAMERDQRIKEHVDKVAERFDSQDVKGRINSLDAWADLSRDYPGSDEVLKWLPQVMRHLKDTNQQVIGAVLDAWKMAARVNPGDKRILSYLPVVAEKFTDPDEYVRYAAASAWEAAAKANPGDSVVEATKEAYESGYKKRAW